MKIVSAGSRTVCTDFPAALSEIALRAHQTILPHFSLDELIEVLTKRELVHFTSTPEGVAFPHAICERIAPNDSGIVILTLAKPILWGSHKVEIVVGLLGSTSEPWRQVRNLARIARVCSHVHLRQQLIDCSTNTALLDLFDKECNNDA